MQNLSNQKYRSAALKIIEDSMKDKKELFMYYWYMGDYYSNIENYDRAEEMYENLLKKYSDRDDIPWMNIASLYYKKGDLRLALKYYEKVYEKYGTQRNVHDATGGEYLSYVEKRIEEIKSKLERQ